ncbi:MAG: GNAT family protein [Rhodospirillales bacterium]
MADPLEDDAIRLRLMERRDIDAARRLHNEFSVLLNLTDIRQVTEPEQEAWFDRLLADRSKQRYVVTEIGADRIIGTVRVDQIDLANRNAMIGTDIDAAYRGKGYGRRSFRLIADYLFRQMGLHRIWLVTLSTNDVALSMYRTLGMKEEGVWRDAIWRDGGYVDLIQFGILRDEWG